MPAYEDTLYIKAAGCGLSAKLSGEANLGSDEIPQGTPIKLHLKLEANEEDPYQSLSLVEEWSGGPSEEILPFVEGACATDGKRTSDMEFPIEDGVTEMDLVLPTTDMPLGRHSLRIHVSHDEFNTTLFETSMDLKVVTPEIKLEMKEPVTCEACSEAELTIWSIGMTSPKIRGSMDIIALLAGQDDCQEMVVEKGKKVSLVQQRPLTIKVKLPEELVPGTYDLRLIFDSSYGKASSDISSFMTVYDEGGLTVQWDPDQSTIPSSGSTTLYLKVKNMGLETLNAPLSVDLHGSSDIVENAFTMSGPVEMPSQEEIEVELTSSGGLRSGTFYPVLKVPVASGEVKTIEVPLEVRVVSDHEPKLLGVTSDSDVYAPGDLAFIRVQHSDVGALPGMDLDMKLVLKAPNGKVALEKIVPVHCSEARSETEFQFDVEESSPKGFYALTVRLIDEEDELVKSSYPKFIQVSGGIRVDAQAILERPNTELKKRLGLKYDNVIDELLLEREGVYRVNRHSFILDKKEHSLTSHSLTSSSKVVTMDGHFPKGETIKKGEALKPGSDRSIFHGWQTRMRWVYASQCTELARFLAASVICNSSTLGGADALGDSKDLLSAVRKGDSVVLFKTCEKVLGVLASRKKKIKIGTIQKASAKELMRSIPLIIEMSDKVTSQAKKDIGLGIKGETKVKDDLAQLIRSSNGFCGAVRSFDEERASDVLPLFRDLVQSYIDSDPDPYISPEVEPGRSTKVVKDMDMALSYISCKHALDAMSTLENIQRSNFCEPETAHSLAASLTRFMFVEMERQRFRAVQDPNVNKGEYMRAASMTAESLVKMYKSLRSLIVTSSKLWTKVTNDLEKRRKRGRDKRAIKVFDQKAGFFGAPSKRCEGLIGFQNTGEHSVNVDLFFAFPDTGWSLAEPGSVRSGDVYTVTEIEVPAGGFKGVDLGINLPRDIRSGNYTYGIQVTFAGLMSDLQLSTDLEFEQDQTPSSVTKVLKKKVTPVAGLDAIYSVKLDLLDRMKKVKMSQLSKNEREMVNDGELLIEAFGADKGLKKEQIEALSEFTGMSPLFDSKKVKLKRGLIFTKSKEFTQVRLHGWERLGSKDIRTHLGAAISSRWARGCVLAAIGRYIGDSLGLVDIGDYKNVLETKYAYRASAPTRKSILSKLKKVKSVEEERVEKHEQKAADRVKRYNKKLDKDRWFKFSNGMVATSVTSWLEGIYESDAEVIAGHLRNGDFSEWISERTPYRELGDMVTVISSRLADELSEELIDEDKAKVEFLAALERTELSLVIHQYILEPLVKKLDSANEAGVMDVLASLKQIKDPHAVDALVHKLFHPSFEVRKAVIATLVEIGDKRALPHLEKLAKFTSSDEDKDMAENAIAALNEQ